MKLDEIEHIPLNRLVLIEANKIRDISRKKVEQYKARFWNGETPPPIKVGPPVNNVYPVLAGFHRVTAAQEHGHISWLPAIVINAPPDAQPWLAVEDNAQHGLALSKRDVPKMLAAYLLARKHHKPKDPNVIGSGGVKSYAEIAADLFGLCSRQYVGHLIKKNHRNIWNRHYRRGEAEEQTTTRNERMSVDEQLAVNVRLQLDQIGLSITGIRDPNARLNVLAEIEAFLTQARAGRPMTADARKGRRGKRG